MKKKYEVSMSLFLFAVVTVEAEDEEAAEIAALNAVDTVDCDGPRWEVEDIDEVAAIDMEVKESQNRS